MKATREILDRAVAAVLLIVFAIGVPWALSRFCVPIPTRPPTLENVRALLNANRDPEEVVVVVGGYLTWFLWAIYVVVNVVTAIDVACQLRLSRLRFAEPLHPMTRSVLTSLTVVLLSGFPRPVAATASTHGVGWPSPAAVVTHLFGTVPATSVESTSLGSSVGPESVSGITGDYLVVAGDTLWGIAEHELGDPYRWSEIHALNEGRAQTDGRALIDPGLISPGWVLRLPVPVIHTDSGATPIEPLRAPNAVLTSPLNEPAPTTSNPSANKPAAHSAREVPPPGASGASKHKTLQFGIAGSVIAFAVVTALTAVRRRHVDHREAGDSLPRPEPRLVPIEIAARAAAAQSDPEGLDRALGTLTAPNRRLDTPRAKPVAVEARQDSTVVMLNQPDLNPPQGWNAKAPGWLWVLPHATDLEALERETGDVTPTPALVTIGRGREGDVLLDLEACGIVCIAGEPTEAYDLLRSATLELCLGPRAQNVRVLFTDAEFARTIPHTTGRLCVVANLDDAIATLQRHAQEIASALRATNADHTFAARCLGREISPVVLILTAAPNDSRQRRQLEHLIGDGGAGSAVFAIGAWPNASWTLHVDDGILDVPHLGIAGLEPVLDAQSITTETAAQVVDLLDEGANPPTTVPLRTSTPPDQDEPSPERATDPSTEIEVRVLGEIDVIGATRPLTATEKELVTFLALRRHPVDADTIQAALWPDSLPAPKRWWNVVSETRGALGTASDGEHHLPAVGKGQRLYLSPTVATDLDRLTDRIHAAATLPTTEAIDALTSALAAVSGRPFTASRGDAWANDTGIVSHAEAVVVDATHRLVLLLLDEGDATAALAATNMGLRGAPSNEALYRDRMLAHDLAGNLPGIEAEFRDLCRALELTSPRTQLHPDTLKLYDELTGRCS